MKVDKSLLIISIAAGLLILGVALFLSLWIDPTVGILSGAGAFIVLIVLMLLLNHRK